MHFGDFAFDLNVVLTFTKRFFLSLAASSVGEL